MSYNAYEYSTVCTLGKKEKKRTCSATDLKNWKWHNMTLTHSTTDSITA